MGKVQADVRLVVVVESAVKGALWDSACLSSGLNVTDDRDHWSFFSLHISQNLLLFTISGVYYRDTDTIVILLLCLYLMLLFDKWVLDGLFLTGVNTSRLLYPSTLVAGFDSLLLMGFFCASQKAIKIKATVGLYRVYVKHARPNTLCNNTDVAG